MRSVVARRDLKPGYILLRTNVQPVLVDFVMARMLELSTLTVNPTVLGTLTYMAPEQLGTEKVDQRADIYSFGVLLFELISGQLPHSTDSFAEFVGNVRGDQSVRVEVLPKDPPKRVVNCLLRCLDPVAERRYPSAKAVHCDLEASG